MGNGLFISHKVNKKYMGSDAIGMKEMDAGDTVSDFIVFEEANDKITKKGAKYHRFFAVRLAAEKTAAAVRAGDRWVRISKGVESSYAEEEEAKADKAGREDRFRGDLMGPNVGADRHPLSKIGVGA